MPEWEGKDVKPIILADYHLDLWVHSQVQVAKAVKRAKSSRWQIPYKRNYISLPPWFILRSKSEFSEVYRVRQKAPKKRSKSSVDETKMSIIGRNVLRIIIYLCLISAKLNFLNLKKISIYVCMYVCMYVFDSISFFLSLLLSLSLYIYIYVCVFNSVSLYMFIYLLLYVHIYMVHWNIWQNFNNWQKLDYRKKKNK